MLWKKRQDKGIGLLGDQRVGGLAGFEESGQVDLSGKVGYLSRCEGSQVVSQAGAWRKFVAGERVASVAAIR